LKQKKLTDRSLLLGRSWSTDCQIPHRSVLAAVLSASWITPRSVWGKSRNQQV